MRKIALRLILTPLVCALITLVFVYGLIRSDLPWALLRPVVHKEAIDRYAELYNVDPLLVMAIVKTESSFRYRAYSTKGAVGLMQIMPETAIETARKIGLKQIRPEELENPELNLRLGIFYISQLQHDFGDDDVGVLAAYNAGPTIAKAWKVRDASLTLEKIAYAETRSFVRYVMETKKWLERIRKLRNAIR